MFEFLFIAALVYLYMERRSRKKREGRKMRGLDAELKTLIDDDGDKTGIAFEIKQYLLAIVEDDKNDVEKFSDARIAQAERILSEGGNLEPILWELGVLAGLIISLAVALSLARRHGDGPRELQAD